MAPKLRVLIPSKAGSGYPPTVPCPVNSKKPTPLVTDGFEGEIWVYVKGYNGELKKGEGDEYFRSDVGGQGGKRDGMSYGIIVRGHFKKEMNADQVVFGNVFEKPIRDNLPWGTSVATKFMYFIDPTVEADIYADKPWALSPALATMGHLSLSSKDGASGGTRKVDGPWVDEDSVAWLNEHGADISAPSHPSGDSDATTPPTTQEEKSEISLRRKWLGKKENREKIKIGKDTKVEMEFCNGLLDFNTLSATLPSPFSLSIPLLKYWDGQPVTYACQSKPASGNQVGGDVEVYWSVAFEIVDEEARAKLQAKGGEVHSTAAAAGTDDASGEQGKGKGKGKGKKGDEADEEGDEDEDEGEFEDAEEGDAKNDDVD